MLPIHTRIYMAGNYLTTCVRDILKRRRQNQRKMLTILTLMQRKEKIPLPISGLRSHNHVEKVTVVHFAVAMAEEAMVEGKIVMVFPPAKVGKVKANPKAMAEVKAKTIKEKAVKAKAVKAKAVKVKILTRNATFVAN
jgi:hypothetical protein